MFSRDPQSVRSNCYTSLSRSPICDAHILNFEEANAHNCTNRSVDNVRRRFQCYVVCHLTPAIILHALKVIGKLQIRVSGRRDLGLHTCAPSGSLARIDLDQRVIRLVITMDQITDGCNNRTSKQGSWVPRPLLFASDFTLQNVGDLKDLSTFAINVCAFWVETFLFHL